MNEEIEYAEMLEIPVSTVKMVRKKHRRKRAPKRDDAQISDPSHLQTETFLRDSIIAQVNDKMETAAPDENTPQNTAEEELFAEGTRSEGYLSFEPDAEHAHTVRLYASGEIREPNDDEILDDEMENAGTRYAMNGQKPPSRGLRILLNTELALACALCGAIFLTNAFLPNSAINTFFRSMTVSKQASVAKHYSEFELAPIVSMRSDAELNLSSTGVLSFTDDCCVYPAANGSVQEILHTDDGLYTVKIGYTDSFTGVFYGLNTVYYQVGDEVKANVPVGYSTGDVAVQVTMYSDGELLNCFELTEENCLAWIDGAEE